MWRLYSRQWLTFYASRRTGLEGGAECEAEFNERYRGRVEEYDWRIETPDEGYGRSFLWLRVPNCQGEFKTRGLAEHLAGEHPGHPHTVVERGSPAERELQAYGIRRLRRE